jgi:hypothetical protein
MLVSEKNNRFEQNTAAGIPGSCNDVELSPRETSHCIMLVSKWPILSRKIGTTGNRQMSVSEKNNRFEQNTAAGCVFWEFSKSKLATRKYKIR